MELFKNDEQLLFDKLAAYCLGELDEEEMQAVQSWIEKDEVHQKQYEVVRKLLTNVQDLPINIEQGWLQLNEKIKSKKQQKIGRVRKLYIYRAAAIVFGVLAGGYLIFNAYKKNKQDEWVTVSGKDSIQLADGSLVVAEKNAVVRYRKNFNVTSRNIQLKGNAFFKVYRNTQLPFTIDFSDGKVTVLGTQFYIHQNQQGFDVQVQEGKVKTQLTGLSKEAILQKGQMVKYDKKAGTLEVLNNNTILLKYQNEPLEKILNDILFAKGIVIQANEDMKSIKLTVDFTNNTNEEIMQMLELLTKHRIKSIDKNTFIFLPK